MLKVVCGFNGTVYSRHRRRDTAERAAEKVRRSLRHPNCGSLAGYVEVVPAAARFTRIVPADNEFGCVQVSQARWVG
jgi:hypothetical protein